MWAFGRLDIGLSDAEFWDMTIEEFTALSKRQKQRERMLNYRAGITAAAVLNVNRGKTQEAVSPFDFFGEDRSGPVGMTDAQIMSECNAAYARACATRRKHG